MSVPASAPGTMRTVCFHENGEPADVLRLETAPVPEPGPGRIRVAVHACGLAPADWALCRGLFPGSLPRGIGCDVSGIVDAVGPGVTDVAVGDRVFGTADFAGQPSAARRSAPCWITGSRCPRAWTSSGRPRSRWR